MNTAANFTVGQLVATRSAHIATAMQLGLEVDDTNYGLIGRITGIEGENVTFKRADGVVHTFDAGVLIAAVHYDANKKFSGSVGERASVFAIDHPRLGEDYVITSEILFITAERFFETRNTLYMPNVSDPFGFGIPELMLGSPYLAGEA